jgi:hypothetical protein
MKMGWEIAAEAFAAFDKWCDEHEEELKDMDILQKVDAYYAEATKADL